MTISQDNKEIKGYIFDIQGLSVHDGPGCRTLIFLNGCTLNCFWCSNPEGICKKPVPMHFHSRCIACDKCIEECREGAIRRVEGELFISRDSCIICKNKSCVSVSKKFNCNLLNNRFLEKENSKWVTIWKRANCFRLLWFTSFK